MPVDPVPKKSKHPFVELNPVDVTINPDDAEDVQTQAKGSVKAKGDPTKVTDAFGEPSLLATPNAKAPKKKGKKAEPVEEMVKPPTIKARKGSSAVKKGLAPKSSKGRGSGKAVWRLFNNAYSARNRRKRMEANSEDRMKEMERHHKEREASQHSDDDEAYIAKRLRQHRLNHEAKKRFEAERNHRDGDSSPSPSAKPGHVWIKGYQVPREHAGKVKQVLANREHQEHAKRLKSAANHPDPHIAAKAKEERKQHLRQVKKVDLSDIEAIRNKGLDRNEEAEVTTPVLEYADGIWRTLAIRQQQKNFERERALKQRLKARESEFKARLKKPKEAGMKTEGVRKARNLSLRETTSLMRKAQAYGVHFPILKEVYQRGLLEWNHSDKLTPQQRAFTRVNSFLAGGKALDLDYDLALESGNPNLIRKED